MWPFDQTIDALNALWSLVSGLPMAIAGVLIAIAMVCLYPVVSLVCAMQTIIQAGYIPFAAFVNALIGIPNAVIIVLDSLFSPAIPSVWIELIAIELMIILGLRLYSFLKDVEIVGCKI